MHETGMGPAGKASDQDPNPSVPASPEHQPDAHGRGAWLQWLARWLTVHLSLSFGLAVAGFVASYATRVGWPDAPTVLAIVLGVAALIHGLAVKALSVDETWATRRAIEITARSYDRGNIAGVMADNGRSPIWRRPRRRRPSDVAKKS